MLLLTGVDLVGIRVVLVGSGGAPRIVVVTVRVGSGRDVVGTGGVLIVVAYSGPQYCPCSKKMSPTGQEPSIDSPFQHQMKRDRDEGSARKVCKSLNDYIVLSEIIPLTPSAKLKHGSRTGARVVVGTGARVVVVGGIG